MSIHIVSYLCIALLMPAAVAQQPTMPADLTLQIKPENVVAGVPEAFTFILTNTSDHDLLLKTPTVECDWPVFDGFVYLHDNFNPSDPNEPASGHACTNEEKDDRAIFDRIKNWKTLHSGESLHVTFTRKRLLDQANAPGTYDFSATYFPPEIKKDDLVLLNEKKIYVPELAVTSNHLSFSRRP